jgi:hypothetical protein
VSGAAPSGPQRRPVAERGGALARSAPLARSGALLRSGGASRAAAGQEAPPLTLLRCRAGPYPLLLDVRALVNVDRPAERPLETGLRLIDLRALLGAPAGPGQSLIFQLDPAEAPVEVMVDAGVALVRVELGRLHPWPRPLDGLPGLRGLSGLVELEDGLAFLVDPWRL